jgi:CHRD domain-containing protein
VNRGKRLLRALIVSIVGVTFIVAAGPAQAKPVVFHAALSGTSEVPGPGDEDGSGAAEVTINVKKQRVCFFIVVLDTALPATAAHIHEGEADVAGDVLVTLGPPVEIAGTGIGLAQGCVGNQPKALLRAIKSDPAGYYVNVHNEDFPDGAVRGQLEAA